MTSGLTVSFHELRCVGHALAAIPSLGQANAHLRIAGAFTMHRPRYEELSAEMVRHVQTLRTIVGAVFGNDWPRLATRLGYPIPARKLLPSNSDGELDPFTMGRIDFVVSGGVPRIVEFNMTSSMGSTAGIEKMQRDLASCSALGPAGTPNQARLNVVRDQLQRSPSKLVYLPTWPWSHIPDPADFFRESCDYLAQHGATVHLVDLLSLRDHLDRHPEAIVLRLFDTCDALAAGIDLCGIGLGSAVRGRWIMSEVPNVVSSKSLLACRALQEAIGDGQGYLAPTWQVVGTGNRDDALQTIDVSVLAEQKSRYVLKPAYGHSGQHVVIGAQVRENEWRSALRMSQESPFVAQRWYAPDRVSVTFHDLRTSGTTTIATPAVFGMYVIGDQAEGVLVRVQPERDPQGAINSGRGAVVSALMLQ